MKTTLLKSIIVMVVVSLLTAGGTVFAQSKMTGKQEFLLEKQKLENVAKAGMAKVEAEAKVEIEKAKAKAKVEETKVEVEKAKAEAEKAATMKEAEEMKISAEMEREKAKAEAEAKNCAAEKKLLEGITVLNSTNTLSAFRDISLGLKELGNLNIKMGSKTALNLTPAYQISIENPRFVQESLELTPHEEKGFKWPYEAAFAACGVGGGGAVAVAYNRGDSNLTQWMALTTGCAISAGASLLVSYATR